jgi:hypothetical protein
MLKDRTRDKTVKPSLYLSNAGVGGTKGVMDNYREKLHAAHSRPMREATKGLVGFDANGNITLRVDPAKVKESPRA